MKKLLCLMLLANSLTVAAQKSQYCTAYELQYDYTTRITKLKSTGQPFTGYEYTLRTYYTTTDTAQIRYFVDGSCEWTKSWYSKGKLQQYYAVYNNGLKKDSICMERISYDQQTGDTIGYEVQYVTKKGAKLYKQYTYYQSYQVPHGTKPGLNTVRTMRFFSEADTKSFTEQQYRKKENFDSAGFHTTYAETGYYYEYYPNGKVRTKGCFDTYEYRVANRGQYVTYPTYGRCGTWSYYREDGSVMREEVYMKGAQTIESSVYYANGVRQARYNYQKLGRDVRLPSREGFDINPNDTCTFSQSYYDERGTLVNESFRTRKGETISYAFHPNGKPAYIMGQGIGSKPFGVHKQWDENGRITSFLNYSEERNDTICYKALNGHIRGLNLRDRNTPINWAQMPTDYYGKQTSTDYLFGLSSVYQEFYINGRVKCEVHLKKGIRDGVYSEWDSLGMQTVQANFKNDLSDGSWSEWYPNGRPKKMFQYKNGIREGACTEFYPNGMVKWENIYINGKPGTAKAYSENGTLLPQSDYITAFTSPDCIKNAMVGVSNATLHHYLADTMLSRSYVTLSDTLLGDYSMKLIAVLRAIQTEYDMCKPSNPGAGGAGEFDIYHSCMMISKSLYTEPNKEIMNRFFARHGIVIDKTVKSTNPVLGLEEEFLVYYSSKQILNKQVIVDSLELYLAPHANDAKQGYLMSIDLNYPKGDLLVGGGKETITSHDGYSVIAVERNVTNPRIYTPQKETSYYIVYDDLSGEYQYTQKSSSSMKYWAGNL